MAQSGYDMYFDKCLFPVTPEKISIKINGNNKTVNLINEGEINILKKTGLTDIEFEAEIPQMLNITNDSQETVSVQGTVNFGGKATDTAMVTISTDFNETIRADMDAKAASGVVQVDFIEIKTT